MSPLSASPRKQKIATFLIHFICIGMLFVLPEVINGLSRPPHQNEMMWKIAVYTKSLIYVAVFYLNYCFFIGKSITTPARWVRFFCYNFIVVICAVAIMFFLWRLLAASGVHHRHSGHVLSLSEQFVRSIPFLVRDLVMVILTIALSVALKLSDRWLKIEKDRRELESIRREEELNNLKSQLNPHFLFNTLNAIYALIAISPDKAQNAVHELSRLLRYVLYENPGSVILAQELDFVRNYVTLMQLRLAATPVSLVIDCPDSRSVYVPPLIFIAIVENAFKYGNTGNSDDVISIAITSSDGVVRCTTSNRYDPVQRSTSSGGIGLANLSRRLHLIYGDTASLVTDDCDGVFTVTLTLPQLPVQPC